MRFEEILPMLIDGNCVQIEGCKWCLVMVADDNLGVACIYISTNDFCQAWNPQAWQLTTDKWMVV
jgi:hypothetical protein